MTAKRINTKERSLQTRPVRNVPEPKIRPETKRVLRGLGGRRVVLEGFGPRAPAFIAITAHGEPPLGAWLSPRELRRLIETARRILQ